jgi:hypothetical protein
VPRRAESARIESARRVESALVVAIPPVVLVPAAPAAPAPAAPAPAAPAPAAPAPAAPVESVTEPELVPLAPAPPLIPFALSRWLPLLLQAPTPASVTSAAMAVIALVRMLNISSRG